MSVLPCGLYCAERFIPKHSSLYPNAALIPLILEPIHRLVPQIKSSVYATVADAKQSAIEWHEKILAAILDRNAEGARSAMTRHLEIAEQHTEQMLAKQGAEKKLNETLTRD